MIPNKLTLHNFMSYKDPTTVDFSSFQIACLCGDNGSGKSTLLEAITFALWNKARAGSDSLIHGDENEMWVDFEFTQDKKIYRVIRKRSKKKRGTSELDFFVYDKGFLSLSGATVKETEQKIDEVIKLPYEIFVNSAYLKQGHADEFTTTTPANRKKVLGNILGLAVYDELERRARDLAALRKTAKEQLQTGLADIDTELIQMPIYEAEMG